MTRSRLAGCFFGSNAFRIAVRKESPLIRWAAQSAEISLQFMPQTFSVYVLKKMSKSRLPKRLVTQSSKLLGLRTGQARAFRYESRQAADSQRPSFRSTSRPQSGYEKNWPR